MAHVPGVLAHLDVDTGFAQHTDGHQDVWLGGHCAAFVAHDQSIAVVCAG